MSSSSDEDLSKFREAADVTLFNNSLFTGNGVGESTNVPAQLSLRHLDAPDENRTDLKVTPGFQKHVATRLMQILDSSLDQDLVSITQSSPVEHDSNGNCTLGEPPETPEGGIKLFGASAAFIASCNIIPPSQRRRKRGRRDARMCSESDGSSSNEADTSHLSLKANPEKPMRLGLQDETDLSDRFAACAVSPEWILKGEAVKGWAPSYKSKEPIQGEATRDLIKMTALLSTESVKHKKKKGKHKTKKVAASESAQQTKQRERRGKRGSRKKKKLLLCANMYANEAWLMEEKAAETYKHTLHKEITNQEASSNTVDFDEFPKKKKRSKRPKLNDNPEISDESLNIFFKKEKKKKKKKNSKDRERELKKLVPSILDDEGFDSDPTPIKKGDMKRKFKEELLKLQLKAQRKSEKKWQNKVERLSSHLANLMTTKEG